MTDTTHIEAVARALFDVEYSSIPHWSYDEERLNEEKKSYWECAANAAIYQLQKRGWKSPEEADQIRLDALEEAAEMAIKRKQTISPSAPFWDGYNMGCDACWKAIRALKGE